MLHPYSKKSEVLNIPGALGFKLAETEFCEIVQLKINKGGIVAPHALPINVLFYVLAGSGTISIADKIYSATPGDVIEVNANEIRSWENTESSTLELLVLKQRV